MDEKLFIEHLKRMYHYTRRGEHDSSFEDICSWFIMDVTGKSNGGWDESVAAQAIAFAEHIFEVQPEATRAAAQVSSHDAEAELERFLTNRGLNYTHIPESQTQSPDGYVEGLGTKYISEIKSPILQFDHNATPYGYKHSTTHSKLLDAVHKARRQLNTLDPKHKLPHILVYTSAHPQLNCSNFINAIRGYIANSDGTMLTDLRNMDIFKKTEGIIDDIDLYVWFQVNGNKQFSQVTYFSNQNSSYTQAIGDLISYLQVTPVSTMDGQTTTNSIRR